MVGSLTFKATAI